MGLANAQRTLTYLRIISEFVSQEQYRDVVGVYVYECPTRTSLHRAEILMSAPPISVGIVNEILWGTIGQVGVQSFYYAAYEAIRTST